LSLNRIQHYLPLRSNGATGGEEADRMIEVVGHQDMIERTVDLVRVYSEILANAFTHNSFLDNNINGPLEPSRIERR
jgi:threonine dehydrogenase-like Zn-dependent dehydrogenase